MTTKLDPRSGRKHLQSFRFSSLDIETEKKRHKAPMACWLKKKIVTENLYGVGELEASATIFKM
jgi:hypothetical protein